MSRMSELGCRRGTLTKIRMVFVIARSSEIHFSHPLSFVCLWPCASRPAYVRGVSAVCVRIVWLLPVCVAWVADRAVCVFARACCVCHATRAPRARALRARAPRARPRVYNSRKVAGGGGAPPWNAPSFPYFFFGIFQILRTARRSGPGGPGPGHQNFRLTYSPKSQIPITPKKSKFR